MKVPFLDIHRGYLELKEEIDSSVKRVLQSGRYILGEEVTSFEDDWAAFCEAKYAVGVANGLDALYLALKALGIGSGDEVLVPSNTYIATWLAVTQCGATPIGVEPDLNTFNIDPARIEENITNSTKAIIPVHLYGLPADLDPIVSIAKRHGLFVVEDAAQAHGARYKGQRIGAHGDVVAWSFYPGKNLGAFGDGGAITTNEREIADRVSVLRNYGSRKKYEHEQQGINSRLDTIQAAILRAKLPFLDEWNARRGLIAERYSERLLPLVADINSKSSGQGILRLPEFCNESDRVWHLYVIRHANRKKIQRSLFDAGIETIVHYPIPPHLQQAYSSTIERGYTAPIATKLADEVLSLPIGPHQDWDMVDIVCDAFAQSV